MIDIFLFNLTSSGPISFQGMFDLIKLVYVLGFGGGMINGHPRWSF